MVIDNSEFKINDKVYLKHTVATAQMVSNTDIFEKQRIGRVIEVGNAPLELTVEFNTERDGEKFIKVLYLSKEEVKKINKNLLSNIKRDLNVE